MAARKGAASPNPKGRPKGTKNKVTQLKEKALVRILSGHRTPLDFLLKLMESDDAPLAARIDAAKAAAPYVHRRMPIAIENSDKGPFRVLDERQLGNLSEAQLLMLRDLLKQATVADGGELAAAIGAG